MQAGEGTFHAAARSSEMRRLDARDYYVVPSSKWQKI